MDVELLVVPSCPNELPTRALLRRLLDDVDLPDLEVKVTVVDSQSVADERGFVGSPTIFIDGVDPLPAGGAVPSVACRLYPTADGLPNGDVVRAFMEERKSATGAAH